MERGQAVDGGESSEPVPLPTADRTVFGWVREILERGQVLRPNDRPVSGEAT
jgi:hypothetical protein